MYIFVTALVVSSKRSCNLSVFLDIEYCYLLMRAWRPTVEFNIYQKTDKHAHFFQWHCYEKKLRYVQTHFSSSNSSFEVMDNVLKLLIRGVNKNSLSASSLYFISPKLNLLYFILDCRYYKSLIKHVYQLPPPPALLIIVFVSRLLCTVK